MALADIGWLELAEAYANQVRRTVNSLAKSKKERGNVKNIPYTDKFVEALSNFEERVALVLGKSPPPALGERGAGRWLLKKMTDMVKSSASPPEPDSKQLQPPVGQQATDVDLCAAVNLPSSAAAVAHHQSNCTTPTLQQPFCHGGSSYQPPSDKGAAVTSEAAQPMQQQHGLPFAKMQQSTTSPPQVLFHPYAPNSMPLSQQQGQYNAAAGSSVASQSEEPSLPQSQSQQYPATMFRTFAQNPAMHEQDQTAPPYPEQPVEHQQQQHPSPHPTAFNSNMYTPTILQQKDHHDGGQSQEALRPDKAQVGGRPKEKNTITTNQSNTFEHSNSRDKNKGMIKSAPVSANTTPVVQGKKLPVSDDTRSECNTPSSKATTKPGSSQKVKSTGFLRGLVQKVTKVVHPEATVADLGGDMQAYWDENTNKWVFPSATEGNSSEGGAIKQGPEEAASIPDALAALMAPPPIQAFGAGRVGAASHSAMTTPPTTSHQPVQHPVCWTPPRTAGT